MKVIDLSQTFENNMSQFPGTPPIHLEPITSVEETGFQVTDFHSVVHVGTHCDAPAHFISGATTIDQLPLDQFVGEAILIDVTHVQERKLSKEVLRDVEVKEGDIVIFHSNLSKKWNTEAYAEEAFSLSEELAEELVRLQVKSVGLDFISPDEVTTETSPIHHILLGNDIYLIENLTNLDAIGKQRFFFSAAPLKIKNSDGAFARAFAVIF
ncbi:cyclase family protein [Bacillus sp. DX1.1]|uniref:cyclase family protein n=1 Tax=unclassified Bacillus (in: firmicutes) TaxID=185979 RepID=UPI002570961B|nr:MULTISPECIES: cyclase family protein [unclassified Bacillus (in: firmicutes)]MDM5153193.1 cyclase family protein [Bacillus sp. DX1.1]WJE82156.1 cyclase family protein [Bacillus sp. DX3.1]